MEIRINLDDELLKELNKKLHTGSTQTVFEAITLLNWAVKEASEGRFLVSVDKKTSEPVKRLAMPSIDNILI